MKKVFHKDISDQGARFHPTEGVDVRDAGELPLFQTNNNPEVGRFGHTRKNRDGSPRFHGGIDILGRPGDPIYAAHAGVVTRAGYQEYPGPTGAGFGLRVYVRGDGVLTVYAHLSSHIVLVDEELHVPGALIGFMGRSGNVDRLTKTHVHFEVRLWDAEKEQFVRTDPEPWLAWEDAA